MYPNPANVLPFPPHPSLEQYKKRAKELVKACKSGERDTNIYLGRRLDREPGERVENERRRSSCVVRSARKSD